MGDPAVKASFIAAARRAALAAQEAQAETDQARQEGGIPPRSLRAGRQQDEKGHPCPGIRLRARFRRPGASGQRGGAGLAVRDELRPMRPRPPASASLCCC